MTALLCVCACAVYDTVKHSNIVGHDRITICVCACAVYDTVKHYAVPEEAFCMWSG